MTSIMVLRRRHWRRLGSMVNHRAIEDGVTWNVLLMPYMEAGPLYDKLELGTPGYSAQQRKILNQDNACLKAFLCPSRRTGIQDVHKVLAATVMRALVETTRRLVVSTDDAKWFQVTGPVEENCGVLIGAERFTLPEKRCPSSSVGVCA